MTRDATADFVIVGAGSAGCVLANRLSADPRTRVLLLEAGGRDRSVFIRAPGGLLPILHRGWYSWLYQTVPQVHARDRVAFTPRGKVLGGSSSINGMVYDRGTPEDYDRWADLGNAGWSWSDVLPYFRKLEDYSAVDDTRSDSLHGYEGPVAISRPGIRHPLSRAFVDAARSAGLPYNGDFNGASRMGVGPTDVTARDGRRSSAARAYLHPVASRPNLRVVTGAEAQRILFEDTRAVGVECVTGHGRERYHASREVIVCSGAFGSPKLLMLSGVGRVDVLERAGLHVHHELPGVGRNYREHLAVTIQQACRVPVSLYNFFNPLVLGQAVAQYALNGGGFLGQPPMEAVAYLRGEGDGPPDLKIHFAMALYENLGRTLLRRHGFFAHVDLLQPESVGEVRLASADPSAPLLVDPNILADRRDVDLAMRAVQRVRTIFSQPAFDEFRGEELTPGASLQSDEELEDFVRRSATPDIHSVGTCRMGLDAEAVVDSQLRVRGLSSLRVVDASVLPRLPSGNTNAPVMMVAERAADLIMGAAS